MLVSFTQKARVLSHDISGYQRCLLIQGTLADSNACHWGLSWREVSAPQAMVNGDEAWCPMRGGGKANGLKDEMNVEIHWALLLTFHEDCPGLSPLAPPV